MTIRSLFQPRTFLEECLVDELAHAKAWLDRLRRVQQQMLERLLAQGVDEIDALALLADSKGYRALRRDENFYQQSLLRLSRRLDKVPQAPAGEPAPMAAPAVVPLPRDAAPRNAVCPCGSGLKYKRCCLGKPLPRAA